MQKVAIHSAPRSGSTWLGNIFNSHPDVIFKYQPLFSHAFKGFLNTTSNLEDIDMFFKKIQQTSDYFMDQKAGISGGLVPDFNKNKNSTHIVYKEVRYHNILENMVARSADVKYIFIIRNPLAVLFSWKNAPKEFRVDKGWKFEDEWRYAPSKNLNLPEEYNGYEKWKSSALIFRKLEHIYPNRVKIITYSDLLHNTQKVVENLCLFVGLKYHKQMQDFIDLSNKENNENAYSVFKIKKEDKDWIGLPNFIIDYVHEDLKDSTLNTYLKE